MWGQPGHRSDMVSGRAGWANPTFSPSPAPWSRTVASLTAPKLLVKSHHFFTRLNPQRSKHPSSREKVIKLGVEAYLSPLGLSISMFHLLSFTGTLGSSDDNCHFPLCLLICVCMFFFFFFFWWICGDPLGL